MVDLSVVNTACLGTFGESLQLTRSETGVSETITGIVETGIQPEGLPPGDGSTYVKLWTAGIASSPSKGDEVATATTVYKILELEQDANGGLWLLLRYDRAV